MVRVDSGIKAGGAVSPFYDPMLAKLIVLAEDRPAALALMEQSLRDFQVESLLKFLSISIHFILVSIVSLTPR